MTYGISHQLFEPRILAVVSFLLALPPAIFIKYSGNELLYYLWKQLAKRQGFRRETYYESRFILNDLSNPTQLFQQIATRFKLHQHDISTYHDIYFTHHIPIFSERTNTVKSREIIDHATGTSFHNLEIVHFLPTKKTEKNSIFNYYYSKKEKGRKDISTTDREVVLKTFPFRPGIAVPSKQISFERKACFDKEIRITLDTIISSDTPKLTHVMEVKVYQDISALTEVMKYIIGKGHIHLTTYGKYDLM
ncbi:MAG: hypothetical protein LBG52_00320 [Candidatus Peribacteria bacterium]|jgi:hypothetical protein|nr:hypothetical protein [Candidatus Peribacteria bacterium]